MSQVSSCVKILHRQQTLLKACSKFALKIVATDTLLTVPNDETLLNKASRLLQLVVLQIISKNIGFKLCRF